MPHLGHTSQKSLATPLFYVPLCYYNSIHHLHQYKYIKKQPYICLHYYTLAYNKPFINTPYLELIST